MLIRPWQKFLLNLRSGLCWPQLPPARAGSACLPACLPADGSVGCAAQDWLAGSTWREECRARRRLGKVETSAATANLAKTFTATINFLVPLIFQPQPIRPTEPQSTLNSSEHSQNGCRYKVHRNNTRGARITILMIMTIIIHCVTCGPFGYY